MDSYHKELLKELKQIGSWHHKIKLDDGIFTSEDEWSYNPETRWKLIEPYVPKDLSGKTVLDLGCNSGYFSVQMKKRGAARVVSVDNFETAIKQTEFLSKWFKVDLEIVKEEAHVFCLTTAEQFDYVIFLGLFYHLKYPVLVLDRLAEMAKSRLYFQTETVGPIVEEHFPKEDYSRAEGDVINESTDFPKLLFIEKKYINGPGNWWVPNDPAVISMLRNSKLNVLARPSRDTFVCEPKKTYGKKIIEKNLVFPKYGKGGFGELVGQKL